MAAESRHVAVAVARPWQEVAAYVGDPGTLSTWAEGIGSSIELHENGTLTAATPGGRVTVRFVEPNPFGVADHDVSFPDGRVVHVPLRVLPLGDQAEVVLTIRRGAGMDDDEFDRDEAAVRADLARLKQLLERGSA